MSELNPQEVLQWMEENLLTAYEISLLTGKSKNTVDQAGKNHIIPAFFEKKVGEVSKVRLFLKSDVEIYQNIKRGRKKGSTSTRTEEKQEGK